MKKDWKNWFISKINSSKDCGSYDWQDRNYEYTNISSLDVPFHDELKEYIYSLDNITENTDYFVYHIHVWNEGSFFSPHIDKNFNRSWAYVCELQPSICDTSLVVEGVPLKEGIFDSNTVHEVPSIKRGTRISLTIFGSPIKSAI